jgi:hypothetical protein
MPHKKQSIPDANIKIMPTPDPDATFSEITIGDLHANAILLLYFLVRSGIITIEQNAYNRLVELYYDIPIYNVTEENLAEFKTLIETFIIAKPHVLVRLIGDETADRGVCDWYILLMLHKLHRLQRQVNPNKQQLVILYSNHGAEFIQAYEKFEQNGNAFVPTLLTGFGLASSLINLEQLVKKGFIKHEAVFEIINETYKPCLRVLDCTYLEVEQTVTLYSHAAIDLIKSIPLLAERFNVTPNWSSLPELLNTIERINAAFSRLIETQTLNTFINQDASDKLYAARETISLRPTNVLEHLIWNRAYDNLERPIMIFFRSIPGFICFYVHGHDPSDFDANDLPHLVSLDSYLGKTLSIHTGDYRTLETTGMTCRALSDSVGNRQVGFFSPLRTPDGTAHQVYRLS